MHRVFKDLFEYTRQDKVPLLYYIKTKNVGDLISAYIVEKITNKSVYSAQSRVFPHLSAVGSTIGSASKQTHIWGSGLIDGKIGRRGIRKDHIYALRGRNTLNAISQHLDCNITCPLGDPAILMPDFYDKQIKIVNKIGVVPHFDEYDKVMELFNGCKIKNSTKIIDVRQDPEKFIDELRSCEFIASSSLHGLILADAYQIPSVWFSSSNKLIGGHWKFADYFTSVEGGLDNPFQINNVVDLECLLHNIVNIANVRTFLFSSADLKSSFPSRFA